jgi:hypothetical protein
MCCLVPAKAVACPYTGVQCLAFCDLLVHRHLHIDSYIWDNSELPPFEIAELEAFFRVASLFFSKTANITTI